MQIYVYLCIFKAFVYPKYILGVNFVTRNQF